VIASRRRAGFARWFARRARRRLRARFGVIEVAGLDHLRETAAEHAVVVVANHTSWWDALMLLEISMLQAGLETYAMMDAAQLRRHRFFALVGGFGVDRGSRRDGVTAIRHGAELASAAGRAVWVFPQGRERPSHEPLSFFAGAARMAALAGARVVPVGLRYVFAQGPRPLALASIGPPLPVPPLGRDPSLAVALQERGVHEQLRRIDRHLEGTGNVSFLRVFERPEGRIDRWSRAVLDRFAGVWLGLAPAGKSEPPHALPAEGEVARGLAGHGRAQ
jgi:1-acyl-sn-glycerol-3-phosphate acyltransferase